MKKLIIIGAGGFGRECAEIAKTIESKEKNISLIGFLDDNKEHHGKVKNDVKVLGSIEWIKDFNITDDIYFVCAIGDTIIKKKVVERALKLGYIPYSLIHPSVHISYGVSIGDGVILSPGSVISTNCVLEDYVVINQLCSLGHDAHIGKYTTVNPSASINGGDQIGEGVYIGSQSSIIQFLSVGKWSIVGAGACITKNIDDYQVVQGVPAKVTYTFRDHNRRVTFSRLNFNRFIKKQK